MKQKTKRILKYLFGVGAGCILAGAVIGGVVSCSNGSTTTSQPQPTKPTPSGPTYQLQTQANTSTIAYKSNQTEGTSMIATNVSDYNTLISEPNNVIISVLGQPEAVINVKNDINPKTAPNIKLDLNQNSQLFAEILNGTNTSSDLKNLDNLITLTTTTGTKDTFNLNNYEGDFVSKQNIALNDGSVIWGQASANTLKEIGFHFNGAFVMVPMTTFWSDLHPANNGTPSLTITTTNNLYWKNSTTLTPFNLTINLLPLIKFSTQKTTLSLNSKDEISHKGNTDGEIVNSTLPTPAWNLVVNDTPITSNEFIYVNQTWYMNVPKDLEGLSITPIYVPTTLAHQDTLNSIPYIYVDDNMYVVGMTTSSTIQ